MCPGSSIGLRLPQKFPLIRDNSRCIWEVWTYESFTYITPFFVANFLKQTKKQRARKSSQNSSVSTTKLTKKQLRKKRNAWTPGFDLFDSILDGEVKEIKTEANEFEDKLTVGDRIFMSTTSLSEDNAIKEVVRRREASRKIPYSGLAELGLSDVYSSAASGVLVKKTKNDTRSRAIKKHKAKLRTHKKYELRAQERKRELAPVDRIPDWSALTKLAIELGYFNPRENYRLPKRERLIIQEAAVRQAWKYRTKMNKKKKAKRTRRNLRSVRQQNVSTPKPENARMRRRKRRENMVNVTPEAGNVPDLEDIGFEYGQLVSMFDGMGSSLFDYGFADFAVNTLSVSRVLSVLDDKLSILAVVQLYLQTLGISTKTYTSLLGKITSIVSKLASHKRFTPIEPESLTDGLDSIKRVLTSVMDSSVIKATITIITACLSMELLGTDISEMIIRYINPFQDSTVGNFLLSLLDAVTCLIESATKIWNGHPITQVLFEDSPQTSFYKEYNWLVAYKHTLYTGLPVEGKIAHAEWVSRCRANIALGTYLMTVTNKAHKASVQLKNRELQLALTGVNLSAAVTRIMPFGGVIHGLPGVGKSFINKHMRRLAYIALYGTLDGYRDEMSFTRSAGVKHWDGYDPMSHPFIFFSEVANEHANIVKNKGSPDLVEIHKLMDRNKFLCEMSDIPDKGTVYAIPKLMLIETNIKDMHLDKVMSCGDATRRRFVYIEVSVKPQFQKEGSHAADEMKMRELGDESTNFYNFTVSTYVICGASKAQENVKVFHDLSDFNRYMVAAMREHYEKEQRILDSDGKLSLAGAFDHLHHGIDMEDVKSFDGYPYEDDGLERKFVSPESGAIVEVFKKYKPNFNLSDVVLMPYKIDAKDKKWAGLLYLAILFLAFWSVGWRGVITFIAYSVIFHLLIMLSMRKTMDVANLKYAAWKTRQIEKVSAIVPTCPMWFCDVKNRFFDSIPFKTEVTLGIVGVLSALYLFRNLYKKALVFLDAEDATVDLHDFEKRMGTTGGYTRVPNHTFNAWEVNISAEVNTPCHKGKMEELSYSLRKNLRYVLGRAGNKTSYTHIFGLYSNYALINWHFICPSKGITTLEVYHIGPTKGSYITYNVSDVSCVRIGKTDMAVIRLESLKFRNSLKHFVTESKPLDFNMGMIGDEKTDITFSDDTFNLGSGIHIKGMYSYKFEEHRKGVCGTPLFCKRGVGAAILSLHSASAHGVSHAQFLNQDMINTSLKLIEEKSLLMPVMAESSDELKVDRPVRKSPVFFVELLNLDYMGKAPGQVCINRKSKLKKTLVAPYLPSIFMETFNYLPQTRYGKPLMAPLVRKGEYISPVNNMLLKMDKPVVTLNTSILEKCVDVYLNRIISMRKGPKLSPLGLMEAINGVQQDPFVRRINPRTSAGPGYNGLKDDYIPLRDDMTRYPVDKLIEDVLSLCSYAEGNTFVPMVVDGKPKDEPLPMAKCNKGTTRYFYVMPLDFLCASRMFLCPFYSTTVEQGNVYCSEVGVNPFQDATRIVSELIGFGGEDSIMELDYSGYDVSMPYGIGLAASSVVYRYLETQNYNDAALETVRMLLSSLLHVQFEVDKDVFSKPGLQPSGKYATAEDNSIRGVLLLMYAWYTIPETKDYNFFDFVLPKVYGDDLLASVKPRFQPFFNNIVYERFCKEHYGMKITPAVKDGDFSPLISSHDMSFLKRTFVWNKVLKRYLAPLSKDSLYKSLEWVLPSSSVWEEMQLMQTCNSFLWEAFQHFGGEPGKHNALRERLIIALEEAGITREESNKLFDYETILEKLDY